MKLISLLIATLLLFTGCAITPVNKVWQPWTRVIESNQNISIHSKFNVTVQGETEPSIGPEELLQTSIRHELVTLLTRRGFEISRTADYYIVLTYKTFHPEYLNEGGSVKFESQVTVIQQYASSLGLGTKTALKVGSSSLLSSSKSSKTIIRTYANYLQIISLEIYSDQQMNNIIWKADALWDSRIPDIKNRLSYTLQLLLSGLPSDSNIHPKVPKIKNGKEKNYYAVNCEDKWYSCPAIPYRIFFGMTSTDQSRRQGYPLSIKNPEALAAYVDIMSTSETALPTGTKKYKDPFSSQLWSTVKLGGKYYLGSAEKPVNVIVEMNGESKGYRISKCWIAKDEEYQEFQTKLGNWNSALQDYYDFYEN